MKLNKFTGMILILLFVSVLNLQLSLKLAVAAHGIIRVPDDYPTIQAAIDAAEPGGTILVKPGTYHERVTLDKPLTLMADGNNTIIDGSGSGIHPCCASGHTVEIIANNITLVGFTIKGSKEPFAGLHILRSALNTIRENKIVSNYYGVNIYDCGPNVLRSNNFTDNHYNFRVWGLYVSHFTQDIDTSNTVNGKPIYYWVNQHDRQIPADAGYVGIVNSSNIVVKDLTLTSNEEGVLLSHSHGCRIRNVTALNNAWGIHILSSHDNDINGNVINANEYSGIFLDTSSNNIIMSNNITGNKWKGVVLSMSPILSSLSHNNTISGNTINGSAYGIYLETSDNNAITGNRIVNNRLQGLSLWSSSDNIFCGNTVIGSKEGIWLSDSGGNIFYQNNVVNNTISVNTHRFPTPPSVCVWHDGYPSGGNYWSDYNGVDNDGDGVGDTPYIIDENNQDNYPLMGHFSSYNVVWEEKTYPVNIICNSTIADFQFDHRESTISFNVTAEDKTIGFCRIMIPRGLMEPYGIIVDGEIVDSTELPISNSTHAFLYFTYVHSSHKVTIVPKLWYLYYDLLNKYTELLSKYNLLNQTCQELLSHITDLQGKYDSLLTTINGMQEQINSLNSTCKDLQEQVDLLGSTLQTSIKEIISELNNIRNLMYIFIATTIILMATTVYFAKNKILRNNTIGNDGK